jgi:hypothetical protein
MKNVHLYRSEPAAWSKLDQRQSIGWIDPA